MRKTTRSAHHAGRSSAGSSRASTSRGAEAPYLARAGRACTLCRTATTQLTATCLTTKPVVHSNATLDLSLTPREMIAAPRPRRRLHRRPRRQRGRRPRRQRRRQPCRRSHLRPRPRPRPHRSRARAARTTPTRIPLAQSAACSCVRCCRAMCSRAAAVTRTPNHRARVWRARTCR